MKDLANDLEVSSDSDSEEKVGDFFCNFSTI